MTKNNEIRFLLCNDDGIEAAGLLALAHGLEDMGTVYVVAPDRERSGAGHSLTFDRPVRIRPRNVRWHCVDGTPTDCVNVAIIELLKDERPCMVVSGINDGPNLGDDVTYSGTVAAALEGSLLGIPSMAISLATTGPGERNFSPAVSFARRLVALILQQGLPKGVILNVNVPNLPEEQVISHEVTRLGRRRYGDVVKRIVDPRGSTLYWLGGGDLGLADQEGTDSHAIDSGRISVTPLRTDVTHDSYLERLRDWEI